MPSITFIDRDKVVMKLIKERCKLADKQADKDHYNSYISRWCVRQKGNNFLDNSLYEIFPPRREWCGLGRKRMELDSVKRNELKLKYTYLNAKRKNCHDEWFLKLCDYADSIVKMAISQSVCIDPPSVTVIEKKRVSNTVVKDAEKVIIYRPICSFPLKIKIVFSLLNKFLTQKFDGYFSDCSFAFRANNKGGYKLQHLNAVDAIRKYRKKNGTSPLYVAECDMKKFYDTINHVIIKQRFSLLLHRSVKDGLISTYEAKLVKKWFFMYVDCFNFREHVFIYNKKKPNDPFWRNNNSKYLCRIEWVDELGIIKNSRKEYNKKSIDEYKKNQILRRKNRNKKVGVPQGGPLSGLIANIVMKNVDDAVEKAIGDNDILYCRFCDDMILIGKDELKVNDVFIAYKKAIGDSLLFAHPEKIKKENIENVGQKKMMKKYTEGYDEGKIIQTDTKCKAKSFWIGKTKSTYEWGEHGMHTNPWITFVGFDINWNGNLRIRKSSLKKHMTKQYKIVHDVIKRYKKGKKPRYSKKSIKLSLENKLICMSVGRVNLWNYMNFNNNCSWMNAFLILDKNPWSVRQIKDLDRHRNAMIKKMKVELHNINTPKKNMNTKLLDDEVDSFTYNGCPYSYYGQCFVYKKIE